MGRHIDEVFWVADDGSYGYGWIGLFDKSGWSEQQHAWLDRHLSSDEPILSVVKQIDNNEEPKWEEEEDE